MRRILSVHALWVLWLICSASSARPLTAESARTADLNPGIWATTTWGTNSKASAKQVATKSKSTAAVAADERSALLAFKQTLSSSDAAKLASWEAGTNHCNGWQGIQCLSNRRQQVYLIDLSEQGLQFALSNLDFAALPALQALWLQQNQIIGSLDALAVPGILGKLTDLRLHDNSLTGTLPSTLPPKLKKLHLQNNQLNGSLPAELGSVLPDLEVLLLASNNFAGTVPGAWKGLNKLTTLSLANNANLTGCLPEWTSTVKLVSAEQRATGPAAVPNTQICGLCSSAACTSTSTTVATAPPVPPEAPAATGPAAAQPQQQPQPVLQPPAGLPAPTAAGAGVAIGTPAAPGQQQPAQPSVVQPAVAAAAPTATTTPASQASPGSTGPTPAAAAAPAITPAATSVVPAASPAVTPAATPVVPPAAPTQLPVAPAAGAPAAPAPTPAPTPTPVQPTVSAPAAAPTASGTPVASPVAQPAIVAVGGPPPGAPAAVPPARPPPLPAPAPPPASTSTPVDPALTVISGKDRKPTYI